MARPQLSPLQRQIARVSRRLFLQTLLVCLLWCWAGALVLSAGWFLLQPYLLESPPAWLRLAAAGGAVGCATLVAFVGAVVRAPSRLAAALLLDERFGLKERVTTSLTLAPGQETTPAAQALLADVNQRIGKLDVRSRFPVRVSWLTTVAPACAAALAVAFYYQPPRIQATPGNIDSKAQAPENAAEIEQKVQQLRKRPDARRPNSKALEEELRRIDAEISEIVNRPRATKEQLRERIKEMTALEDSLKNREREMADRSRSLKQQLRQMDQIANQNGSPEGPGKELQKALSEGKLDQAKEEIQRLTKKLKENQLSEKDKQQLAKQLKDLQEQLERLAEQKDKKEQLKKLHEEGKLDAEALKRELKQLEEDSQKLRDLQKLASKLGQCQQALRKGNSSQAAQSLEDAADQLQELDLQDQDLQDLREQLQQLQDAKDSC
jgi:uncharacterized coiled-coil DUF342 family protein